jgi:CPA1 family monovalent cation:H+ antiporter
MTRDSVLHRFDKLGVWSRGDQRAPHKPLLVLYALGRWSRGGEGGHPVQAGGGGLDRAAPGVRAAPESYHAEYPFWRLQNDGVWAVHASGPLTLRRGQTDAETSEPLAKNAAGGFTPAVQAGLLVGNPGRRFAMSPTTVRNLTLFWELTDEVLNAVLLVLLGLAVLAVPFDARYLAAGVLAVPAVLRARLASVGLPVWLLRGGPLDRPSVAVLTWGGCGGRSRWRWPCRCRGGTPCPGGSRSW